MNTIRNTRPQTNNLASTQDRINQSMTEDELSKLRLSRAKAMDTFREIWKHKGNRKEMNFKKLLDQVKDLARINAESLEKADKVNSEKSTSASVVDVTAPPSTNTIVQPPKKGPVAKLPAATSSSANNTNNNKKNASPPAVPDAPIGKTRFLFLPTHPSIEQNLVITQFRPLSCSKKKTLLIYLRNFFRML